MATTIPAYVRVRRGTAAKWQSANPLLKIGEMGLVTDGVDKGKIKVGDGNTVWNSLTFVIGSKGEFGFGFFETSTLLNSTFNASSNYPINNITNHSGRSLLVGDFLFDSYGFYAIITVVNQNTVTARTLGTFRGVKGERGFTTYSINVIGDRNTTTQLRELFPEIQIGDFVVNSTTGTINIAGISVLSEYCVQIGSLPVSGNASTTENPRFFGTFRGDKGDKGDTAGLNVISISDAFLTRAIGGVTEVSKSLFAAGTVFAAGKTVIGDKHGTVGVYTGDYDSANISVITGTTSYIGAGETPNLGTVQTNAELPLNVTDAIVVFGRTPSINDYATVRADETQNGFRVEWYIVNIDENGNIEWGNPVLINASDYQEQSTIGMAGKVLTGGATAGTFGDAKSIDTEPTAGSNNLISSGAVKEAISPLAANSQSVAISSAENTNKFSGTITQNIGTWFQQIGQKINGLISNIININTNITNINTSIAKIKRFTAKTDGLETFKTGITSFNYSGIMLVSVYCSYDNSNTIYFVIYKNGQYTKQTPLVGSTSNYGYSQISFSMQSDGINISIGDYPFNINILFLDGAV